MIPRRPEGPRSVRPLPRLDGGAGPAHPLSPPQIERAVDAALRAAMNEPRAPVRLHKKARVVIAAVFLASTLGSIALAAVSHWRAGREPRVAAVAPPAVRPTPVQAGSTPVAPAPSASDDAPPAVEPPVAGARPKARAAPGSDLLSQANALRAARRWREATSMYERAVAAQPGSDDAYAALVAAASLRCAHLGDPRGALRLLATADRLRPGGPLAEEVAWSRILSYRALAEPAEETLALESFVATYGESPWQSAARKRLEELTK